MTAKQRRVIYAAAILALLTFCAWWAPKGLSRWLPSEKNGCIAQVSPKGSYRVDICRPAFPYVSFNNSMPRFVRFYDQRSKKILGESEILDMSGRGEVFWPQAGRLSILVGGGDGAPEVDVSTLDGQ